MNTHANFNESCEQETRQAYRKKQEETLSSLKVGTPDLNGYTIKNIYARGDEYLIYDSTDISMHQTIRVIIYTKIEEDTTTIKAFNNVKIKFDRLKSVLYKSGDNPLHKQRAASAIVIALQEPERAQEVNKVLDTISGEIAQEYTDKLWGRLSYLAGTLGITILSIALAFLGYINRDINFIINNHLLLDFLYCSMFASIGGFFSVSLKSQSIFIMQATSKWMYFLYGLERNFIAVIAGLACFVLLSSEIVFANIKDGNTGIFFTMSICFFSGFSEKFIPNALSTLGNE